MRYKHTATTALGGLKSHRLRSLLTILGIVIGITAIILVLSLGRAVQSLILNQIQGIGSNTIAVIPGREPNGPSDAAQIFSDSLKARDLESLKNKTNVPGLSRITPIVFGGEKAEYRNQSYRLTVFGTGEDMAAMFDLSPALGSFFTDEDIRSRAAVVVIGDKARRELFGDAPALGEKIRIKNKSFRVIGVLPQKGQLSFFNFDEAAIMPVETAKQYLFGIAYYHRFIIEAASERVIAQTAADITATLRENHRIPSADKDDFFVQTQADLASRLKTITSALTLFLAAVASISLFVGGIGIMNIMLVSVTERTREIGLRKALGATNRDILSQFLIEAVILTALGGGVGIFLGFLFAFAASVIISQTTELLWTFSFPYLGALLGIIVSISIGLVFGLYPARVAAKKTPIDALRYE